MQTSRTAKSAYSKAKTDRIVELVFPKKDTPSAWFGRKCLHCGCISATLMNILDVYTDQCCILCRRTTITTAGQGVSYSGIPMKPNCLKTVKDLVHFLLKINGFRLYPSGVYRHKDKGFFVTFNPHKIRVHFSKSADNFIEQDIFDVIQMVEPVVTRIFLSPFMSKGLKRICSKRLLL